MRRILAERQHRSAVIQRKAAQRFIQPLLYLKMTCIRPHSSENEKPLYTTGPSGSAVPMLTGTGSQTYDFHTTCRSLAKKIKCRGSDLSCIQSQCVDYKAVTPFPQLRPQHKTSYTRSKRRRRRRWTSTVQVPQLTCPSPSPFPRNLLASNRHRPSHSDWRSLYLN